MNNQPKTPWLPIAVLLAAFLVISVWPAAAPAPEGLVLNWGGLGRQLVEAGVIDEQNFLALYRGGELEAEARRLLEDRQAELTITAGNAPLALNLLWALGLGNKNEILEQGPMSDPRYGGAAVFASTGGWSLARGSAMDHYSRHRLVELESAQQQLVESTSKNIYRPCCANPAYFPDCNHGLAMLALLELMASEGASEAEMYAVAEEVNGYWFPQLQSSTCAA